MCISAHSSTVGNLSCIPNSECTSRPYLVTPTSFPPVHLGLLRLINCKFHHSCFGIKLKFLSSVNWYFQPRIYADFFECMIWHFPAIQLVTDIIFFLLKLLMLFWHTVRNCSTFQLVRMIVTFNLRWIFYLHVGFRERNFKQFINTCII